jgi:hypothetical protein
VFLMFHSSLYSVVAFVAAWATEAPPKTATLSKAGVPLTVAVLP